MPVGPQNRLELALSGLVLIPESITVVTVGEAEFMSAGQHGPKSMYGARG